MIVHTAQQGSSEWAAARRGCITASRFKDCRDKLKNGAPSKGCFAYAMDLARERVGGRAPDKFQTTAMRTGIEEEPAARRAYEGHTGELVTEAGFITTDDAQFGVSVDGLVNDDGVIEIKTMVSSETMFVALGGDISAYRDQCMGAMWLLHRQWVDLVLWAPDLEPIGRHLTIVRIDREEAAIEVLVADLMAFRKLVERFERVLVPVMEAA